MSRILETIEYCAKEFYPPVKCGEDWCEIWDKTTDEYIDIGVGSAFNAMVLAMKQLHHTGIVSIVHRRECVDVMEGTYREHYRDYTYDTLTGIVACINKHSSYRVPGERDHA